MNTTIRSDVTAFGFTVKDVRTDCTDYKQWFELLEKNNCKVTEKYGEKDSKGKLHYHGIVEVPKKLFRKKLMLTGIHWKFEELYDKAGWQRYCKKDQKKGNPFLPREALLAVATSRKNNDDLIAVNPELETCITAPPSPRTPRHEMPTYKLF